MPQSKPPFPKLECRLKEAEDLLRALRTHQVDAIVGQRHVMVLRLKQAEENLKNSRNQLRALATRLQVLRETERTAIARELHDEFGQTLTSLQLGLSWIAGKVGAGQPQVEEKARSLAALVTTLTRSVKTMAVELRPGALDELGLVRTLESEARQFEGRTGVRCRFETNLRKAKFDRLGSVTVFRIVQAALTNVARHAQASKALISLKRKHDVLFLTVSDNGKGIAKGLAGSGDSLGIIGMQERAFEHEGTLTIWGPKGKGTTLTVRIPLNRILQQLSAV